jgi:tetratricopeptide (TPR) repeat protein
MKHALTCRAGWIVAIGITASVGLACSKNPDKAKREALAVGTRYLKQARYQEAIVEFRRAAQIDPAFGEAHLGLSRAYFATHDDRNAYREALRAGDLLPENVDAQLQAGRALLVGGDFQGAKERALRVLQKDKRIDAEILLGNALAGLKDLDGAIAQVEQALDEDPQRLPTYSNLAVLQYAKGNVAASESAFKRAIALDPNSDTGHLGLANLYWATGRKQEAEGELKEAIHVNPKSDRANEALATFYLGTTHPADAEPYLRTLADHSADYMQKIRLADFLIRIGQPNDAKKVLQPLVDQKDAFAPAMLRLAEIQFREGNREEADKTLNRLLQREPQNGDARATKVRFLLRENKNREALDLAKHLVGDNPASAVGHFFDGLALSASRDADGAIDEFREVLRLSPAAVPAQIELARLYLGRGDPVGAAGFAEQAIKAQPQLGLPHLLLAKALAAQGNLPGARTQLALLEKSNPQSFDVAMTSAAVYAAMKDFANAENAFVKASNLRPESVEALRGLVNLDLARKKPHDAEARIEAHVKAYPNDAVSWQLAGETYQTLGESAQSESALLKAIELDPKLFGVYQSLARLYVSEKRLDDAKEQFKRLVDHQAKPVGAWTMMGMVLNMQNKDEEARVAYEKALALDPRAPIAANNLAWVYAVTGRNLDLALQLAQTAKSQLPERHEFDDTLGYIYYKKGLATLAISSLQQSVAADPGNPTYLCHLGLAYAQNGDTTKARKSLEQALKIRSDFEGAAEARKVLISLKS